jgi:hypothetical protein
MTTSHEQAIARLMGADLRVWSAYAGSGCGTNGAIYGCNYGHGNRTGDGIAYGIGYVYPSGQGFGYGYSGGIDGNGESRRL